MKHHYSSFGFQFKIYLHDIDDDEKRDTLNNHSERIIIAFGLLNTKSGTSLQITKNLTVRGDCHSFTNYIVPSPEFYNLPVSCIHDSSVSLIIVDTNAPTAHIE